MMNIPDDLGSEIPLNGHQLRSGNRVTKQQLVLFDGFSVFFVKRQYDMGRERPEIHNKITVSIKWCM